MEIISIVIMAKLIGWHNQWMKLLISNTLPMKIVVSVTCIERCAVLLIVNRVL